MLVGRYYLDQGRPLAAALRFERLVASPVAARLYEPELSVLLATCWLLAEMPDRAGRRWSLSRRATRKRRFASVTKKCHYSRTTAKRSPGCNNSSARQAFPWTKRRRSGFCFVATRRGTPRAGGLSAAHGAVACPSGQPSERRGDDSAAASGLPGPARSGDSGPAAARRGPGRDHADGPPAGGGRHGDRQTDLAFPWFERRKTKHCRTASSAPTSGCRTRMPWS